MQAMPPWSDAGATRRAWRRTARAVLPFGCTSRFLIFSHDRVTVLAIERAAIERQVRERLTRWRSMLTTHARTAGSSFEKLSPGRSGSLRT